MRSQRGLRAAGGRLLEVALGRLAAEEDAGLRARVVAPRRATQQLELVAALESVLKRNPDHPAANHFYIHAVEASPNLERAIPSAMRLMTLVPGAGHLVHMPGHIFLQTGDFELAAQTNVKAAGADQAFVERTGATGVYPLMYWTHNVHFISYARSQQGRYDEAKQAAVQMTRQVGDADLGMQMLEGFLLQNALLLKDISASHRKFRGLRVFFDSALVFACLGYHGAPAQVAVGVGRAREAGVDLEALLPSLR